MRAINATVMRQVNRTLIMNQIRLRPISRAELAEETGLTRASVTQIVEELISEGIVQETSIIGRTRLGRRSTQLAINPQAGYIFGVNMGLDECTVGVIDMHGQVLRQSTELIAGRKPCEVLDAISTIILKQEKDLGITPARIRGIGMSVPGPVNPEEGRMLASAYLPEWKDLPVAAMLGERTGLPVYLESAADAQALEEKYFGRLGENFILIRVAETVSIGVVVQGSLYRGSPEFPVELGRCPTGPDGEGCLDALISIPALLKGTPYRHWDELMAACEQDPECQVLEQLVRRLGLGIANIIHAFRIDRVMLSEELGQCACLRNRLNALLRTLCQLPGDSDPIFKGSGTDPIRQGAAPAYHNFFS